MKLMKDIKKKLTESTTLKVIIIIVLIVLFMIPNAMVKELIFERQNTEFQVKKEIGSKWGAPQFLTGPFLVIPYKKKKIVTFNAGEEKIEFYDRELQVLPKTLNISGDLNPIVRKRGIYKAILYDALLDFEGNFELPDFDKLGIDTNLINWNKIVINIGIKDMGGIKESITLKWGNINSISLEPGIKGNIAGTGASAIINFDREKYGNSIDFSFNVKLQGSESIYFTPLGKTTTVALKSSWDSPSFQGRFVPDDREISSDGFTANWKILDMNRNYPQQWEGSKYNITPSKFGVKLIKPVGEYQKNMRTIKYSLLIIVLIFLIYFFFEILGKFRIHPIQYSFIGLALTMFFVLLLSISEQLGFNIAYLISSLATSAIILIYSASLLKDKKKLGVLTGFLALIYGFIYIVLQLEDYALLAGSIGLFLALFAAMFYSRKIDWYNININIPGKDE